MITMEVMTVLIPSSYIYCANSVLPRICYMDNNRNTELLPNV